MFSICDRTAPEAMSLEGLRNVNGVLLSLMHLILCQTTSQQQQQDTCDTHQPDWTLLFYKWAPQLMAASFLLHRQMS